MNIPQDTLQDVADAAFVSSSKIVLVTANILEDWKDQSTSRRAVIQHALDNPALAPFLAGGIGEYTNEELLDASNKVDRMRFTGFDWLRAFLAALPRRESPSLAEAIARAEKAEAERDRLAERVAVLQERNVDLENQRDQARQHVDATLMDFSLATQNAEVGPEPAAQVPLGPEDVPPGSVFRNAEVCWYSIKYVLYNCVCIDINGRDTLYYGELKNEGWQINTSLPDTGRWDENAWRPCSKPGKEVAK